MDNFDTESETPRAAAQGRSLLPRSRSCDTLFQELTPTGEISIRMQQHSLPRETLEKDSNVFVGNRPCPADIMLSAGEQSSRNDKGQVQNRATVAHCGHEDRVCSAYGENAGGQFMYSQSNSSNAEFPHAASRTRYGIGQTASGNDAQGDQVIYRRAAASGGISEDRSDGIYLPRTLDRGVSHNNFYGGNVPARPAGGRSDWNFTGPNTKLENDCYSQTYNLTSQNTKLKKPALYDGTGNWEDYLVQFELISAINKWTETEKALELATSLRGTAQSILTDLHPEMRVNYRQLTLSLASRFQPENQAEMYRAQMKSKLRGRTESIPVLGQDIKRLVRLAYPSAPREVKEQLARDCFIDSLNDADMEWAIFQAKAKNIDDAVQVALEYEAFQNGRRKHIGNRPVRYLCKNDVDVTDRESYLTGQIGDISSRLAKIESSDKPSKPYTCYHCGLPGHIKKNCPKIGNGMVRNTYQKPFNQNCKNVAVQTNYRGN